MSKTRDLANLADLNFDSGTMVVDKVNDRVGIGTSSPDQTLVVKTADGGGIAIENAAGNQYRWAVNGDDTFAVVDSGTAERLRIDSSGNVLVGTTSYNSTLAGHGIGANGFVYHTRDNAVVTHLNRKTSDGDIVEFRKDGTTVGSIGSVIGARLRVDSNSVAGYLGIAGTDRYYWNNTELGVNSDNAYNLGSSGSRFKDLYLSGGAYLGGTSSANYLDDYEEGTWTPVISAGSGSFTSTTGSGRYTKIGNTVHCWGYSQITNVGSGTTVGGFAGLPFASINDSFPAGNRGGIGIVREDNRTGFLGQMFIQAGQPYGVIQLYNGANMLTPSTNDTFLFEVTYKTNA